MSKRSILIVGAILAAMCTLGAATLKAKPAAPGESTLVRNTGCAQRPVSLTRIAKADQRGS